MHPPEQLREALSWRLITEMWRRFPDRYALIEMHPGGGLYDCLSLIESNGRFHSVLDVNRNGSIHVHRGINPRSWSRWLDRMLTDPRSFLDDIGAAIGVTAPEPVPSSTPATITFRFICEFLTHAVGRLECWECRNGVCDTSGFGAGRRDEWFNGFPAIEAAPLPARLAGGRLEIDYAYWFILKNEEPIISLDTDGRLYKRSGDVYDLAASYAKHKRIWPVILDTAIELLP